MKKKLVAALLVAVLVLTFAGLFAYDYMVETGPTTVTVTYYKVDYFGNTGAAQQQLPDTVVQFAATFEVNSGGLFHTVQRQAQLNFDDFYLTSGILTLTPLQGYSDMMSHGDFTIKSGSQYAWDAVFVVEKGVSNVELHYNGTANVNIVHIEAERPDQNYLIVGQK